MIKESVASTPTSRPAIEASVSEIYQHRFPKELRERRRQVWKVLCDEWLMQYVPANATVVELGAGYCEFINNVSAKVKIAVDINSDTKEHAHDDVTIIQINAAEIGAHIASESVDIVFMSNFLEHCRTRDHMLAILCAVRGILKPSGHVLILGPNYRFCYREYYDYFDHHLALSERAVVEALNIAGLRADVVQARTLPLTFRTRLPTAPWLVRLYLKMTFAWRFFGAQFFIVAGRQ